MIPPEYLVRTFWDAPAREPHGDSSVDAVYRAVGHSLSQWELLEVSLSSLFGILVQSTSPAAKRAYGAIVSAAGRIDALDRAAEVYFSERDETQHEYYNNLSKIVRYASPRRNEIAHGIAECYADISVLGGGYYLTAPAYNSRKHNLSIDLETASDDP